MEQQSTLDCQDCGVVLKTLSQSQRQQVAEKPYNFIAFCKSCSRYQPDY